mgnify:CR=1 FL=1
MPYSRATVVYDPKLLALCRKAYEGHPKGCPNWRKRVDCPPQAGMLPTLLDLGQPVFAVWNVFDLGAHIERMRGRHPGWSWRQLTCCLYWQGTARKALKEEIQGFLQAQPYRTHWRILTCPEACGLNVTAMMKTLGHNLEWPPMTKTYQVALAGEPKDYNSQSQHCSFGLKSDQGSVLDLLD